MTYPKKFFVVLRKSVHGAPSAFGVSVDDKVVKYTHKNCLLRDFPKCSGIPQSEVANFAGKSLVKNSL